MVMSPKWGRPAPRVRGRGRCLLPPVTLCASQHCSVRDSNPSTAWSDAAGRLILRIPGTGSCPSQFSENLSSWDWFPLEDHLHLTSEWMDSVNRRVTLHTLLWWAHQFGKEGPGVLYLCGYWKLTGSCLASQWMVVGRSLLGTGEDEQGAGEGWVRGSSSGEQPQENTFSRLRSVLSPGSIFEQLSIRGPEIRLLLLVPCKSSWLSAVVRAALKIKLLEKNCWREG